jgi:hypothetical protein
MEPFICRFSDIKMWNPLPLDSTILRGGIVYPQIQWYQSTVILRNMKTNTGEDGPGWRSRYSDLLRTGRSGNRILVGASFSALNQTDPGTHPTSSTVGTGSLSRKKKGEAWFYYQPRLVQRLKKEESYIYSPSALSWLVLGWNLPF